MSKLLVVTSAKPAGLSESLANIRGQTLHCSQFKELYYRGVNKGLYVLLSRTQAEPGRKVKQQQKEISRNHVQTFIYLSVQLLV